MTTQDTVPAHELDLPLNSDDPLGWTTRRALLLTNIVDSLITPSAMIVPQVTMNTLVRQHGAFILRDALIFLHNYYGAYDLLTPHIDFLTTIFNANYRRLCTIDPTSHP